MALLDRLRRELAARRRDIRARRKRIRRTRRGPRRTRLIRRQRAVRRRAAFVRRTIMRLVREGAAWGGCRGVTNEVIRFVAQDSPGIPVTSRKRVALFGNPGSDHHVSQLRADAVDFGTANNYGLGVRIAHHLGGSWSRDYESFEIRYDGRRYRVQIIAGTHGTGPHLHVGVRRVG